MMAQNPKMCSGDYDPISCTATDVGSKVNKNVSGPSSKTDLDDGRSDVLLPPPQPVCTSTPCVVRQQPKLLNSTAAFSRLDDSGLGDTFEASPLTSDTVSLCALDTPSPLSSVRETEDTDTPNSFSWLDKKKLQHAPFSELSSTPIDQSQSSSSLLRQHAFSVEKECSVTQTSVASSFQQHRISAEILLSDESLQSVPEKSGTGSYPFWHEEENTKDEGYFSKAKLSVETPVTIDESSQSTALVQHMNQAFQDFTPESQTQYGRKIGLEHVDILVQLYEYGVPARGVVKWLMTYLKPMDFIRMSAVSRRWRHICLQDNVVSRFRRLSLRMRGYSDEKENLFGSKSKGDDSRRSLTQSSGHMGDIQVAVRSPTKHVLSSPDLYEKVRKTLRWEELIRHCPLCHNVAKVLPGQDRAQCQNEWCCNDFCTRCLARAHPSSGCSIRTSKPKDTPGSKKSKKHLKRIIDLDG